MSGHLSQKREEERGGREDKLEGKIRGFRKMKRMRNEQKERKEV